MGWAERARAKAMKGTYHVRLQVTIGKIVPSDSPVAINQSGGFKLDHEATFSSSADNPDPGVAMGKVIKDLDFFVDKNYGQIVIRDEGDDTPGPELVTPS